MIERVYAAGSESYGTGCIVCILGHGGLTYGAVIT